MCLGAPPRTRPARGGRGLPRGSWAGPACIDVTSESIDRRKSCRTRKIGWPSSSGLPGLMPSQVGQAHDDGVRKKRARAVTLTSTLPAETAFHAVASGMSRSPWVSGLHRQRYLPLDTTDLEVTGYVNPPWVSLRPYRAAESTMIRTTLNGQLTPTEDGCEFTGTLIPGVPGLAVVLGFFLIVGLAVVSGLIGIIVDAAHGHGRQAEHWLPLVLVPLFMLAIAAVAIGVSRAQARERSAFLVDWLSKKLT